MRKGKEKIIRKIFEKPERADIKWREIESFLKHIGCKVREGSGSRKSFYLNGVRSVFHQAHPRKELDKGAVKSLRKYLIKTGIFDEQGNKVL